MKRRILTLLSIVMMALVAMPAGAKKYDFVFDIRAIGEYDFNGKKFRIEPLYANVKRDDHAFLEFAKPVISYFKLCGADWAADKEEEDFVLQIGWGSDLTEDRMEYTPHYVTDTYHYPAIDCWGRVWDITSYSDYVAGYTEEHIQEWTKTVKIRAVDYHEKGRPERVLWEMTASTKDTHGASIGEAYYYMLYGSCSYIGHSTHGTEAWKMSSRCENDVMYDWIRSGTLCYSTVTVDPECLVTDYVNDKKLDIYAVERLDDRLVVTFSFDGSGSYVIPKELALGYYDKAGKEQGEWPTSVNGIELGKSTKADMFQVTFPAIPKSVKKIYIYDNAAKDTDKKVVQFDDIKIK